MGWAAVAFPRAEFYEYDLSRTREVLGFEPAFTTAEAFADFASALSPGIFGAERVQATESALVGALTSGRGSRG